MAKLNSALSDLQPSQVIYDIIFAYSSDLKSDIDFAKSINDLGNVYLPVAFSLSDKKKFFVWDNKPLLEKSKVNTSVTITEPSEPSEHELSEERKKKRKNFMHHG